MKARFVDTNIFLEALVRTGTKTDQCLKLLENPSTDLWTTELAISEVEWVLRSTYETPKSQIVSALKRLVNLRKLSIENHATVVKAIGLYEKTNADFTDCLNAIKATSVKIDEAYSYDKDFSKFENLKRLEP